MASLDSAEKMTTAISESFIEALAWHALKHSQGDTSASTRTEALKPSSSLFHLFRHPANINSRIGMYRDVVEEVVACRRQLLRQCESVPAVLKQDTGGRVLALRIDSTMYDEVAAHLTNWYFDESDAPPWDTWIGLVACRNAIASDETFPVLLSWIPESELNLARTGIEGCPSGCLFWVSDTVSLIDLSADLPVSLTRLLGSPNTMTP